MERRRKRVPPCSRGPSRGSRLATCGNPAGGSICFSLFFLSFLNGPATRGALQQRWMEKLKDLQERALLRELAGGSKLRSHTGTTSVRHCVFFLRWKTHLSEAEAAKMMASGSAATRRGPRKNGPAPSADLPDIRRLLVHRLGHEGVEELRHAVAEALRSPSEWAYP